MTAKIRVLVADDEPDICVLLNLQLKLTGFEVVGIARDGGQAIDLYREHRPDVVVMDLLMPNVNGFEAIARLQAEFPDVRILAHSGVAGDFVRKEMQRLQVPIILKSGDGTTLVRAIKDAMEPAWATSDSKAG